MRRSDICPDICYRIDECERGAHCLFDIIFLRVRIAEIGEHAMTYVSAIMPWCRSMISPMQTR